MSDDRSFTGSRLMVIPKGYVDQAEFIPPDIVEEIEESRTGLPTDLYVEGLKSSYAVRAAKTVMSAAVICLVPYYACF